MSPDEARSIPGLPDRYRIEGPLGHGGQAQTLAATDTQTGDAVVVKVFRLAGAEAWKRFELFERECEILQSLEHRSIPRYVEHGGDEEAGVFYLVMQRAPGETLQVMIDRRKRFTDAELDAIMEGLLDALAYLHSLNPPVIHRDLKPGNVILGEDGQVWLVDFGSVRDVVVDSRQSTVVGTYGYMAPEQLRGQSSPASDLYGLGATLAAAATGADAAKLPSKGLEVDLSGVIKPGRLRDLLQWLLQADPEKRPASVETFRKGPARAVAVAARTVVVSDDAAVPVVAIEGDVTALVRQGRTIEAIAVYRKQTGASLAAAKAHVDQLVVAGGASSVPQRVHRRSRRPTRMMVLAASVAAIVAMVASGVAPPLAAAGVFVGLVMVGASVRFMRGVQRGLNAPED